MNKKFIALASAALVFCASSVFAANDNNKKSDNKSCTGTEKCDAQKCDKNKKDRKDDRKGRKDRQEGKKDTRQQAFNPFEGLNLTEQQATAIKAIPNPREVMKEAVKNDSQKKTDIRTLARTVRADYLKSVKGVLTPEQYMQFLENSYMNNVASGAQRPGQKGMKPGKDGKKDGRRGAPGAQTRPQDQARR